MAIIRHIRIEHFRGIRHLEWYPSPGINCLIGPGDSGKSTILDAIDLCLNIRRYATLSEADFYRLDLTNPIIVDLTIGGLANSLLDVDHYIDFLRGFDVASGRIEDEAGRGLEPVLTVRLEVKDDLAARWRLYSNRSEARKELHDLSSQDRVLLSCTRLGAYADTHLAWGQRSILTRIGDERADAGAALMKARWAAKDAFRKEAGPVFDDVLDVVVSVANSYAVPIGNEVKALLDTQQVSIANGAISLHDGNDVPLRSMGLGSSRLLVAGLQQRASRGAKLALVDEIEHGLEPYRIAKMLHLLGAKERSPAQLFLTTHSPVVIRELPSDRIFVVRRNGSPSGSHKILSVGKAKERQRVVRACAEAFLTPRVLVCEGKTEVGLVRGFDLYWHEQRKPTLARCGVFACDGGGGGESVGRASIFADLGYDTAILRDNDVPLTKSQLAELSKRGIRFFQWADEKAFEAALFLSCPDAAISELLDLAVEACGRAAVEKDINFVSGGTQSLASCQNAPGDLNIRDVLSRASCRKDEDQRHRNWFKLIEPSEKIGHQVVCTHWRGFRKDFQNVVMGLTNWVRRDVGAENARS